MLSDPVESRLLQVGSVGGAQNLADWAEDVTGLKDLLGAE